MKTIPLTKGQVALVDDEDFESLRQRNWQAQSSYRHRSYLVRCRVAANKTEYMHRMIMGAKRGQYVDHKNGNCLDNRKANLRICTNAQNGMNRGKNSNNTSGFKGVSWNNPGRKWMARIIANGKGIYLGIFDDPVEAAKAYDAAALKYFGEFALLNF